MRKRLLCILLAAVMLLSAAALSGCAGTTGDAKDNISKDASENAVTLVMWLVTNDTTTPEAVENVQAAINKITQDKFKVRLLLKYYTEDEYYQKLEDAFRYQESNGTEGGNDDDKENETVVNDYGFTEIKYPDPTPNQVDIVYFAGYDRYVSYSPYLSALDNMLEDQGMKMTKYISSSYLEGVKLNGTTYAIPNYNVAGKYKYMLIDRELYDKYYQLTPLNEIRTVFDLEPFVHRVNDYEDVLPIDADFEELKSQLAFFWSVNPDNLEVTSDFSLVGYTYTDYSLLNRGETLMSFQNLFENDTFTKNFRTLMEYKLDSCFGTAAEGDRAAVSFVTGNASTLRECGAVVVNKDTDPEALYRDIKDDESVRYYAVAIGYPTLEETDLFSNLFGICRYSASTKKSMTVLNELNTNPALRNLLQYGVEGTNYTLTDKGQVHMLNDSYSMDLEKTGNVMIAYTYEGTDLTWYDSALAQNRDTVVHPLYQFSFYLNDTAVSKDYSFMEYVSVPEEDQANWSAAHTKYYTFEETGNGVGEYTQATEEYDDMKDYYSWEASYRKYVYIDAEGHRRSATAVYDPTVTYYTDSMELTPIDDAFMTEVSLSSDDEETKGSKWDPSKYYVFDEDTKAYVKATGEFDEDTVYYSWTLTRSLYVIKDADGNYRQSPEKFDPTLTYYKATMDMDLVRSIYEWSAEAWNSFMECTTLEKVDQLITSCSSKYRALTNHIMSKATDLSYKPADGVTDSGLSAPYKIYYEWAKNNHYIP